MAVPKIVDVGVMTSLSVDDGVEKDDGYALKTLIEPAGCSVVRAEAVIDLSKRAVVEKGERELGIVAVVSRAVV